MKVLLQSFKNDSMFDNVPALLDFMSDIEYIPYTKLMNPLEVILTKQGSCHDQVMLELRKLTEMGLSPKAKFIIAVDEYGQGLETHSFVYYKNGGEYYWVENAWLDQRGIHTYTDYNEMIDAVMFAFGQRTDFDTLYIADFIPEEHKVGEDLDELVDICMNSAEEYIVT